MGLEDDHPEPLSQALAGDLGVLQQLHGFPPEEVQCLLLPLLGLGDLVLKVADASAHRFDRDLVLAPVR
jgi:hypothetical protein